MHAARSRTFLQDLIEKRRKLIEALDANKGDVNLVISRSRAGLECIGKSIPGVHVIYNARSGFTGTDTMRYGLDVPEGHVSLEVSIVIQAGRASSSPIATSAAGESQPSGPMPECPSLAS